MYTHVSYKEIENKSDRESIYEHSRTSKVNKNYENYLHREEMFDPKVNNKGYLVSRIEQRIEEREQDLSLINSKIRNVSRITELDRMTKTITRVEKSINDSIVSKKMNPLKLAKRAVQNLMSNIQERDVNRKNNLVEKSVGLDYIDSKRNMYKTSTIYEEHDYASEPVFKEKPKTQEFNLTNYGDKCVQTEGGNLFYNRRAFPKSLPLNLEVNEKTTGKIAENKLVYIQSYWRGHLFRYQNMKKYHQIRAFMIHIEKTINLIKIRFFKKLRSYGKKLLIQSMLNNPQDSFITHNISIFKDKFDEKDDRELVSAIEDKKDKFKLITSKEFPCLEMHKMAANFSVIAENKTKEIHDDYNDSILEHFKNTQYEQMESFVIRGNKLHHEEKAKMTFNTKEKKVNKVQASASIKEKKKIYESRAGCKDSDIAISQENHEGEKHKLTNEVWEIYKAGFDIIKSLKEDLFSVSNNELSILSAPKKKTVTKVIKKMVKKATNITDVQEEIKEEAEIPTIVSNGLKQLQIINQFFGIINQNKRQFRNEILNIYNSDVNLQPIRYRQFNQDKLQKIKSDIHLPSIRPKLFKNETLDVLGDKFELINHKEKPIYNLHNNNFNIVRERVFNIDLLNESSDKFDILINKKKSFEANSLNTRSDFFNIFNIKEKIPFEINNINFELIDNSIKIFKIEKLDMENSSLEINKIDKSKYFDINNSNFDLVNIVDRCKYLEIRNNYFDLINIIDKNKLLDINSQYFESINKIDKNNHLDINSHNFDLINIIDRNKFLDIYSQEFDLINIIDRNKFLDMNSYNFDIINNDTRVFANKNLKIEHNDLDLINTKNVILDFYNDQFELTTPEKQDNNRNKLEISNFDVLITTKTDLTKKKVVKIIKKIVKKPENMKEGSLIEGLLTNKDSEGSKCDFDKINTEIMPNKFFIELSTSKSEFSIISPQTKAQIVIQNQESNQNQIQAEIQQVTQTETQTLTKSETEQQTQPPVKKKIMKIVKQIKKVPTGKKEEVKDNPITKAIDSITKKSENTLDINNQFNITLEGKSNSRPYTFRELKRGITFSNEKPEETEVIQDETNIAIEEPKSLRNYLEEKLNNPFDDNETESDAVFVKLREKIISGYLEKQKKKIKEQLKDKIKQPADQKVSSPNHSRNGSCNSIEVVERNTRRYGCQSPLTKLNLNVAFETTQSCFELLNIGEPVPKEVKLSPNLKKVNFKETKENTISKDEIKKETHDYIEPEQTSNTVDNKKKALKVELVIEKEDASSDSVEEEEDEEEEPAPKKKINIVSVKNENSVLNSSQTANNMNLVKLLIVVDKVDVGFKNFFMRKYFKRWKPLKVPSFASTFKSNKQLLNKTQIFKRSYNNLDKSSNSGNSLSNSYSINIKYEVILNRLVDLYKSKNLSNVKRYFTKLRLVNETSYDKIEQLWKKINQPQKKIKQMKFIKFNGDVVEYSREIMFNNVFLKILKPKTYYMSKWRAMNKLSKEIEKENLLRKKSVDYEITYIEIEETIEITEEIVEY